MNSAKPWYTSKTIWASLVAILAALSTGLGYPIDSSLQAHIVDTTIKLVGLAASIVAIFGRLSANARIV